MIGAIVAGGSASRFGGAPKGLHVVGGRRILNRVADALRAATPEIVLASSAADAADWLPGVEVVADRSTRRGSMVGVQAALMHARDSVLVVAWDMPFVPADLLRAIRDRSALSGYAAVPVGPNGPEPLCAAYTSRCLPWIEAAMFHDDLRMSRFVERLPEVEWIGAAELARFGDPARLFFNVNTAADLEEAERLHRGAAPTR